MSRHTVSKLNTILSEHTKQKLSLSGGDRLCPSFLTAGATGQRFVARLSTGGDRIGAASPFRVAQFQEFGQWCLTAGTRLHQARGARAQLAPTAVAHLLAPVSFTV